MTAVLSRDRYVLPTLWRETRWPVIGTSEIRGLEILPGLDLHYGRVGFIGRGGQSLENDRRQHGHAPSCPLRIAEKAGGCGMVMIALKASGPLCE